jgi:hypothetical protein
MEWDLELGGAQAGAVALATLFAALLLVICVWNWLTRRDDRVPVEADASDMHAAMARLHGELPQLVRTATSRIDAKMQALSALIQEATVTMDELRRLKDGGVSTATAAAKVAEAVAPLHLDATGDPLHLAAAETAEPVRTSERQAVESPPSEAAELRLQRYAHVYALADSGLNPSEISGETGMHRGEVELVLNLRRKRFRVDRGGRPEPSPTIRSPEEAPA